MRSGFLSAGASPARSGLLARSPAGGTTRAGSSEMARGRAEPALFGRGRSRTSWASRSTATTRAPSPPVGQSPAGARACRKTAGRTTRSQSRPRPTLSRAWRMRSRCRPGRLMRARDDEPAQSFAGGTTGLAGWEGHQAGGDARSRPRRRAERHRHDRARGNRARRMRGGAPRQVALLGSRRGRGVGAGLRNGEASGADGQRGQAHGAPWGQRRRWRRTSPGRDVPSAPVRARPLLEQWGAVAAPSEPPAPGIRGARRHRRCAAPRPAGAPRDGRARRDRSRAVRRRPCRAGAAQRRRRIRQPRRRVRRAEERGGGLLGRRRGRAARGRRAGALGGAGQGRGPAGQLSRQSRARPPPRTSGTRQYPRRRCGPGG